MRTFEGASGTVTAPVPACVTETAWPPTLSVAVRLAAAVFAAMLKVTAPTPVPLAPLVTVSHDTVVVAVQEHCVPLITLRVRLPAVAATLKLAGVTL